MYSAVLMLALTAGNDSVDFGRNRCHGCTATVASTCSKTVATTCKASACSARHGLFSNRCHGCTKSHGCTTTTSCSKAKSCTASHGCSSSCHGGLLSRLFHRGGHGCSHSCTAAAVCSTPAPKPMPKSEPVAPPKKTSVDAPATIVVSLPADARLIVDGTPTTSTSDRRTLVTPELEVGSTYVYTFQAEVVREGHTMAQTQQIQVRGGEVSTVRFNFSTQAVASR